MRSGKFSLPFSVLLFMSISSGQIEPQSIHNPSPHSEVGELKVRTMPAAQEFTTTTPISLSYELTNLTGHTLCLPEPGIDSQSAPEGYMSIRIVAPDGQDFTPFFE